MPKAAWGFSISDAQMRAFALHRDLGTIVLGVVFFLLALLGGLERHDVHVGHPLLGV